MRHYTCLLVILITVTCCISSCRTETEKEVPKATSKFLERIRAGANRKNQKGFQVPDWCEANTYMEDDEDPSTSMSKGPDGYFKVYNNFYFHAGKWYAIHDLETNASFIEEGASVNTGVVKLPVEDPSNFVDNLNLCYLHGNTLLVDFPFPAFPDNLGHFAEIMLPVFSMLKGTSWLHITHGSSEVIDRILLTNLREPMLEWFVEVLTLAVQPGMDDPTAFELPEIIDAGDMEDYNRLGWLAFQNIIVVQDRYTHPNRESGFAAHDHGDMWKHQGCERYVSAQWKVGFATPEHGREFKELAYKRAKWELPPSLPKVITYYMYPNDNPPIANSYELQDMLFSVARKTGWEFRTVTLTMEAPFVSHLSTMADTGLLIGRHGPLLADVIFLPPGAMVMELLPYKWEWQQISRLYYNMTQSFDTIHHFGWRPIDHKWCAYNPPKDQRDDSRYKTWTPDECSSRECLTVHARAGLIVDLETVEKKLLAKIPLIEKGVPVSDLREPWPASA